MRGFADRGLLLLTCAVAVGSQQEQPLAEWPTTKDVSAAEYLSEEEFPGMHILDITKDGTDLSVEVYVNGNQSRERPIRIDGAAGWRDIDDARMALENSIGISAPEPYQQPWALFDAQGRRVDSISWFWELRVMFLLEIGQWMWPAVRVGFEQQAEGVLGGSPLTLRTLSLRPVIFFVSGFIFPDEAEEVIQIGSSRRMFNSEGRLINKDIESNRAHSDYRTSSQLWLKNNMGKVIKQLDERTANLTRVPATHNEQVQLLRYDAGQFYHAHHDWADLKQYVGQKDEWQEHHFGWNDRLATLFWYLNDVPEGGHTVFPRQGQKICPGFAESCAGTFTPSFERCDAGLKVAPERGAVILWYNFHANGKGDFNSLHGGCPPAKGYTKWSGNKWIATKPQRTPKAKWMPDHPALKRYGWNKIKSKSSSDCEFSLLNKHAQAVSLFWVDAASDERIPMVDVVPSSEQSLSSTRGHQFVIKSGDAEFEPMSCNARTSSYVFTAQQRIEQRKAKTSKNEL